VPSLNKVILMGNLTRDPETFNTRNGGGCNASLAMNRKFRTADGGDREETCFVELTIFGKRSDAFAQYLRKGSPVLVEGRLFQDQWEDQEGRQRSKIKVIVDNFEFVSSKRQQEERF